MNLLSHRLHLISKKQKRVSSWSLKYRKMRTHMHTETIWRPWACWARISHHLNPYLQFDKNTLTTFRARLNKEQKFGTRASVKLRGETYGVCTVCKKKNCQTGLAVMRSQVLVHSNVFFFFLYHRRFSVLTEEISPLMKLTQLCVGCREQTGFLGSVLILCSLVARI